MKGDVFFAKRLNDLCGSHSKASFARKCELSQTTMLGYLNEVSQPNLENLLKIASACNVSVGWLAAGEGEQLAAESVTSEPAPTYEEKLPAGEKIPERNDLLREIVEWLDLEFGDDVRETLSFYQGIKDVYPGLAEHMEKKRAGGSDLAAESQDEKLQSA